MACNLASDSSLHGPSLSPGWCRQPSRHTTSEVFEWQLSKFLLLDLELRILSMVNFKEAGRHDASSLLIFSVRCGVLVVRVSFFAVRKLTSRFSEHHRSTTCSAAAFALTVSPLTGRTRFSIVYWSRESDSTAANGRGGWELELRPIQTSGTHTLIYESHCLPFLTSVLKKRKEISGFSRGRFCGLCQLVWWRLWGVNLRRKGA